MKKLIIATACLIATSLFMISCGETGNQQTNDNATEQVDAVQFYCPMKCEGEKTYDEPGTCPVCNMNLVITPETEHFHHQN